MNFDLFKAQPYIRNSLFSTDFIFTGGDLFGGVSFEESVNVGDDLAIGSCIISSIEFQLENLNSLINELTGKELVWKQAVQTGKATKESLAKAANSSLICVNGGVAYAAYEREPYLSIWDAETNVKIRDVPAPPAKPVRGLVVVGTKLYCLHEEAPYLTVYTVSGTNLTAAAAPSLNRFFVNKVKYLCARKYAANVQGNILREYKTDLYDLKPIRLVETAFEYIQMGIFIAEKPTKVNDTRVKVQCYDRMGKLDRYVDDWLNGLQYPLSLKSFLQGLCQYAGVSLVDSTFLNQDYQIPKNFNGTNISGIQALRWMAEIAACFGRMDEQGRLALGWYQPAGFTADSAVCSTVEVPEYQTTRIEKVQVRITENDVGVIVPPSGAGTNSYLIENNPLLYAESDAEIRPTVEKIYNAVKAITYQPYSLKLRWEIPLLRAGHIITVVTRKGQSFPAYLMSRSLKSGMDSYEAAGNERRETQSDAVNQSIQRLRGKTHELTISIDKLDSAIYDPENGVFSKIEQTADAIRQEVAEADGDIIDSVSKVEQTANKINWLVKSGTNESDFTMTDRAILLVADTIDLSGFVTFTNLGEKNDKTIIDAGNITTGTINADLITTGELDGGRIKANTIDANRIQAKTELRGVRIVSEGPWGTVGMADGSIFIYESRIYQTDLGTLVIRASPYPTGGGGGISLQTAGGTSLELYKNGDSKFFGGLRVEEELVVQKNLTCRGDGYIGGDLTVSGRIDGDIAVTGEKNCIQITKHFGERRINAYETAEYYFGDIGEGQVSGGECRVAIDPVFLECVNTGEPYQVFLTPYSNGSVYVSSREADSFTVCGDNIPFAYEIKAKRRGYEKNRLEVYQNGGAECGSA